MILLTIKHWVIALIFVAYFLVLGGTVALLYIFYNRESSKPHHVNTKCICEHGTPTATCDNSTDPSCWECDEGYHLDNNQCVENICVCPNGTPAKITGDPACTKDQGIICTSCDPGYFLNDDTKQCQACCTCSNGTADKSCSTPTECDCTTTTCVEKCSDCNTGYWKNGDICQENQCTCNNGTASQGTECPENKTEHCESCDKNYDMTSKKTCVAKCTENPGQTWTPWPTHGGEMTCSYCPNHYYVSLRGTPCTLGLVGSNPDKYQSMCSSFDDMVGKKGAFQILSQNQTFSCIGDCVESMDLPEYHGKNDNTDVVGWERVASAGNKPLCRPGKCFYWDKDTNKSYCMFPCYSNYNSSLKPGDSCKAP